MLLGFVAILYFQEGPVCGHFELARANLVFLGRPICSIISNFDGRQHILFTKCVPQGSPPLPVLQLLPNLRFKLLRRRRLTSGVYARLTTLLSGPPSRTT